MHKGTRNRWPLNLGLLTATGLLLLLLLNEEEPETKITLASLLPTDIQNIRIMRTGKTDIQFEKSADVWHMTSPYVIKADPIQIKNLLSVDALHIQMQRDSAALKLTDFALQEPSISLQLNQTRIDFGGTQPVGKQRYLLLDNKLLLVDDGMQELLNTSSLSFIDRQLVPANASIKAIRIDGQPVNLNDAWTAARANWISLSAPNKISKAETVESIPIEIELNDTGTIIRLIAQRREADAVLIRDKPPIEYHISPDSMAALGLVTAADDSSVKP